ncbi:MAG: ATP/GTP-binding protein [Candidatus Methanomethylicaceae archaeon]
MYFVYIMGTAGSGKSALTSALANRLRASEASVATVNLDPGVLWLPYGPEVDIRDYINYDRMVEDLKLGPNGALVACVDAAVNHVQEMREEVERLDPDYVLVDTPGQMELFAYRDSGTFIASALSGGPFSVIFLADSIFLNRASDFISVMLLSHSVHVRFRSPQINCLSKIDLLPEDLLERASLWASDPVLLKEAFASEAADLKREISERILETLLEIGALGEFIFISSNTGEGLDDLYAQLQRIHTGGVDI